MASDVQSRLAAVANRQTLTLTHQGRKSGKSYEVVIWFMVENGRLFLATANRNRSWVKNVMKRPRVSLRAGEEIFNGDVKALEGEADVAHVNLLVVRKYWWAAPLIFVGRVLARTGVIADTFAAFEVMLDAA
jgi:deazaflavin-dependent oxidoreductase (nitroreductase family)